jgi:hypothetical protein
VQREMDAMNPIVNKKDGTRKLRLHQLLKEERVKDFLVKRIEQLLTIMRFCTGSQAKECFYTMVTEHDAKVGIQIPIEQSQRFVLSMILPSPQLSLFKDASIDDQTQGD